MNSKKFYALFITGFLLLWCVQQGVCSTISGDVTFSDVSVKDSIEITLDSYYYDGHVTNIKQPELNFSYELDPGKYRLSVKSKNTSSYFTNILLDSSEREISFKITLTPKDQASTAKVQGFEYHDQYNTLIDEMNKFNKMLFMVNPGKATLEKMQNHNDQKTTELLAIKANYPDYFEQIFIEAQLSNLSMHHPLTILFRDRMSDGKLDSSDIHQIYENEIFKKFFSENISLQKQLDPNSILLDGTFGMVLGRMEIFETLLIKDGKLSKDYFYSFLTDFIHQAKSKYCAANLLLTSSEKYAEENPGRVMFLLTWLQDDYPDFRAVTTGYINKVKSRIKLNDMKIVPDFSVTSLTGQTLSLADCKDKFIFIDFWATWCSACRTEIPNIIKMFETCSPDILQIIGIAKDKPEVLAAYLEKNNIPYFNALADDRILQFFGVTGYPTTYLIAPNGQILNAYLRGNKLAENVKKEIEKYRENENSYFKLKKD